MNAPETLTETISRHFDDANDPAQTAMLSEQIATDPEVAISFARAARVHGMLQQSLAPTATRSRRWKPLLWISSAAALVIGSFLTWKWAGPHEDAQTKVRITHITDEKDDPKETLTKTIGKVRQVKPALSANAPDAAANSVDLTSYFVDLDIHGMTVENALAATKVAISEVNFYKRPEVERYEFSDVDQPGAIISSFLPRNSSIHELWKVIRIHSRFRVSEIPSTALGPTFRPTEPGGVQSREFSIPSNLLPILLQISNLPEIQSSVAASTDLQVFDWKNLLGTRFGIPLVDGESVSWNPTTAALEIKADTNKLNRFEASLDILKGREWYASDQIRVSQHIINCREENLPAGFDQNTGMLMDAAQFAAFKTSLVEHGNKVVAAPEMVVRDGQSGQISVGREIPHTEGGETEVLWLGQRCDIRVKRTGELISCVGNFEVHNPPLNENGPITTSTIRSATTEFETYIPRRQTALFTIDAPGEKGITLCCLTVRKSHAFENVDQPDELPFGVPVPDKPGFLFSPYAPDKGMIDVRGIPSGTKVACPYTQKIFRVP